MDKIIGIYKITNPKGRVYIGQSTDVYYRWRCYKNLKCKGQPKLLNSFKKHGPKNHKFEIIIECDVSQLNEIERYYQELYNCIEEGGMNCVYQAANESPRVVSKETREKISKSKTGGKASEEAKKSMREAAKNKIYTPELRKKLASMTGVSPSKEHLQKLRNYWYERKHTDEAKDKMRNKALGRIKTKEEIEKTRLKTIGQKRTLESRDRISSALIGYKKSDAHIKNISQNKKRWILNTETGIFYKGLLEAGEVVGLNRWQLGNRMNGKLKEKTPYIYV